MEEIISFVSQVGFPIVAFLLMYKMVNGSLKELIESINALNRTVTRVAASHGQREEDVDGKHSA